MTSNGSCIEAALNYLGAVGDSIVWTAQTRNPKQQMEGLAFNSCSNSGKLSCGGLGGILVRLLKFSHTLANALQHRVNPRPMPRCDHGAHLFKRLLLFLKGLEFVVQLGHLGYTNSFL